MTPQWNFIETNQCNFTCVFQIQKGTMEFNWKTPSMDFYLTHQWNSIEHNQWNSIVFQIQQISAIQLKTTQWNSIGTINGIPLTTINVFPLISCFPNKKKHNGIPVNKTQQLNYVEKTMEFQRNKLIESPLVFSNNKNKKRKHNGSQLKHKTTLNELSLKINGIQLKRKQNQWTSIVFFKSKQINGIQLKNINGIPLKQINGIQLTNNRIPLMCFQIRKINGIPLNTKNNGTQSKQSIEFNWKKQQCNAIDWFKFKNNEIPLNKINQWSSIEKQTMECNWNTTEFNCFFKIKQTVWYYWTNKWTSIEQINWIPLKRQCNSIVFFFKFNKSIEFHLYNQWNFIEKQWNSIEINQCNSIAANLEIAYLEVQGFRLKPWTWRLPISKFRASVWNPELGDCLSPSSGLQSETLNLEIAHLEVQGFRLTPWTWRLPISKLTLSLEIAYLEVQGFSVKPWTWRLPISKFRVSAWSPELRDCLSTSWARSKKTRNSEIGNLPISKFRVSPWNPELGDR